MKGNWKQTTVGDFVEQVNNTISLIPTETYTLLGMSLEGRGLFVREQKKGSEIGSKTLNKLQSGNFIYSRLFAWKGAFDFVKDEFEGFYVSDEYPTFKVDDKKADVQFLHYYFNQAKTWKAVEQFCIGVTKASRNRFKEKFFLDFPINLPDLHTQKLIVEKINKIKTRLEEMIELRKQQEKEMNNLRYSLMCKLENEFKKARIDAVCDLRKGSFSIMKTDAGKYPFVVTAAEFKTANDYDFDCEATCVPLVSSTGHGNAAMHRVHYASGKFALSNLLCAVMPKDKEYINTKFLYELFMAKKDEYFVPIMAGTSNVSLNPGKLGAVEIPIPPIEEQNRIVELLEKINEIKQTHKEQEAELKQLMPSLLDKAFKGEL